jgi:hypothetical protein
MRKGGNPDLEQHQFKCKIADSPAEQLSIRIAPGSTKRLVEKFGKDYRNVIRGAIAKLIENNQDSPTQTHL